MNKHSKQARMLAWFGIILVLCLFFYMIYCAFSGRNFLGSLYLVIVVPVIIWAILFFSGMFKNEEEDTDDENSDSHNSKN